MYMDSEKKNVTVARLDSGELVEYDAAAKSKTAYDSRVFLHIGHGVIYSWNGILQTVDEKKKHHFFVYANK